jgi:uncharacterized membrane protein YdjX (TVP38/TMEM64 family)
MTSLAIARVAVGGLVLGTLGWSLLGGMRIHPDAVVGLLTRSGTAAPLAFVLLYALSTVLSVPGSLLSLAGGALFGPVWGVIYNLAGATLGATLAFLIARRVGGDWVARAAGGRLAQVLEGVEAEGWRFVAMVRLVPVLPFNLLNYALGLTRIPWGQYAVTSLVCMVPGAIVYTHLGFAGREAMADSDRALAVGTWALALLAALVVSARLVRRLWRTPARAALTEPPRRLSG